MDINRITEYMDTNVALVPKTGDTTAARAHSTNGVDKADHHDNNLPRSPVTGSIGISRCNRWSCGAATRRTPPEQQRKPIQGIDHSCGHSD